MAVISTVIFDLDGLLADTEPLHCAAWRRTLADIGVDLSEAEFCDHWIRAGLEISDFVRRRELEHDPEVLRSAKLALYTHMLGSSLRPMPGAVELVTALHGRKRLALASSSFATSVNLILERLDVAHYFETVATHETVARLKPHPDVFLHVAERLGVPPSACVVLEDAEKGVLAARAAGMKVVAVPTVHTRDNDFSKATLVVPSLAHVSAELLDSLG